MQETPINPDATPEARALLEHLYRISGTRIIAGQHNYPGHISRCTNRAWEITGKRPALWGQDFGFERYGQDAITHRQAVMDEAKRKHAEGSIVTLMWHAVRPIDDEPSGWSTSVQNRLTAQEWDELVTPGTPLNGRWRAQVDVIAGFLAQLRDERIPVLWRPYHEMNGGWFWWGKKSGPRGYVALWEMLYERLVGHHGLHNLLWVWNANAPNDNADAYAPYFPGRERVDVLAADVYHGDYRQSHHNELVALAGGKPIALGEVGTMPTPAILAAQPRWAWFMTWAGFLAAVDNPPELVRALYEDGRTVTLEGLEEIRTSPQPSP
jgi:mannan endo-1,4-beta-mannosidase